MSLNINPENYPCLYEDEKDAEGASRNLPPPSSPATAAAYPSAPAPASVPGPVPVSGQALTPATAPTSAPASAPASGHGSRSGGRPGIAASTYQPLEGPVPVLPIAPVFVTPGTGPNQLDCERLYLTTLQSLDLTNPTFLPLMGPGLPLDHVGNFMENNSANVAVRDSSENTRSTLERALLGGRLTFANINGRSYNTIIVDVGAGSAPWAIAIKQANFAATVIAADIYSAVGEHRTPANEGTWSPEVQYKFIFHQWTPSLVDHIRIGHVITHMQALESVFGDCFRTLKPGGSFEIQAFDPVVRHMRNGKAVLKNPLNLLFQLLCRGPPQDIRTFLWSDLVSLGLQEAGFQNIQMAKFEAPIGLGANDTPAFRSAGALMRKILSDYVANIDRDILRRHRHLSQRNVDLLFEQIRLMLDDPHGRLFMHFVVVMAQRPVV